MASASSVKVTIKNCTESFTDIVVDKKDEPVQFQPRSRNQFRYYHGQHSSQKGIKDALLNLHELAYITNGFVWTIRTFPDVVVTFGLASTLSLLLHCDVKLVSYDTTFNLGDF